MEKNEREVEAPASLLDAVMVELARLSAAIHQLQRRRAVLVDAQTKLHVGYTDDEVRALLKKVGLDRLGTEP